MRVWYVLNRARCYRDDPATVIGCAFTLPGTYRIIRDNRRWQPGVYWDVVGGWR